MSTSVFQNLFPARGRKPGASVSSNYGDLIAGFSEPIPRKGTETLLTRYQEKREQLSCFSEPIPRKGTETTTEIIVSMIWA